MNRWPLRSECEESSPLRRARRRRGSSVLRSAAVAAVRPVAVLAHISAGPGSASRRRWGALASCPLRRALPSEPRQCRLPRRARQRRGGLRCAPSPWRRCAPSLSWRRLISVGPDSASRRRWGALAASPDARYPAEPRRGPPPRRARRRCGGLRCARCGGGAPRRYPGAYFGGPGSASRRRWALLCPQRRALPAEPRHCRLPRRARQRRGGLRCAPPPWRRCTPSPPRRLAPVWRTSHRRQGSDCGA